MTSLWKISRNLYNVFLSKFKIGFCQFEIDKIIRRYGNAILEPTG